MIKAVELSLYDENDDTISFELSPKQLEAVIKILGLSVSNGNLYCYSDTGIQTIMDKTINRLHVEE